MKFSDRLLSLVMALTLVAILCFLVLIFQDLNELWGVINESIEITKAQENKIRNLQKLVLSKISLQI